MASTPKPAKRGAPKGAPVKYRAKSKPSGGKVGRPKLDIDPDQVYELARIDCTMQEIADVVGCSVDTLETNFPDIIKKGRQEGRKSLRRAQFDTAVSGNVPMLIWLGKQRLGQKEPGMNDDTPSDDSILSFRK